MNSDDELLRYAQVSAMTELPAGTVSGLRFASFSRATAAFSAFACDARSRCALQM